VYRTAAMLLLCVSVLSAQQLPGTVPQGRQAKTVTDAWGTILHGYQTPRLNHVNFADSERLRSLVRDGKLYLTLEDAISLALENNLDIELERYSPQIADTEVLRSKAGALLRGIPTTVREGPQSITPPPASGTVDESGTLPLSGGNAPALNNLTGAGTTTDVSIIGSIPLSTGPGIPDLDPTIFGSGGWNHAAEPQNSTFLPNLLSLNSNTTTGTLGIEKGFLSGASVTASWNSIHQDVNNPLYLYNPATYSSITVNFTQPLLQGFGWSVNDRYIRIARNNRNVSEEVFRQQVIATVYSVIRLYWDLVSLREDVGVRQEAVNSANRLLSDTQQSLSDGTAAPIDVTRAQAEGSRRQRDLDVSKTLSRQQNEIFDDYLTRSLLGPDAQRMEIVPVDRPQFIENETLPPLAELISTAFRLRPDLAQARLQVENSEISLKGSRSAVLPQLNLVASVQNNSLVGDPNSSVLRVPGTTPPVPNSFLLGSYSTNFRQIFHNNFPGYGAGLSLNIPLANRSARADMARDQLQVRQQEIRLQQLQKQAQVEVTNALIAVQQARETYHAARQERIFQEQSVQAETDRLTVGASTTYLVIQYERDLTAARSAEISALGSYVQAKAALQRAMGTILDENHVNLREALDGVVTKPSATPRTDVK
jgi:outer membrane protein